MDINVKKIGAFLKYLDNGDFIYLKHCVGIRDSISELISRHSLTKDFVCQKFNLKPNKFNDFVKGNYNYTIRDLACLNALYMELESESLKDNVPVKIAGNESK